MYETFEHTADLGLRVRAANQADLFVDAASGLFSVMIANLSTVRPLQSFHFQLQSDSLESLWHDWLSELLFAFHGRRLALANFEVEIVSTKEIISPQRDESSHNHAAGDKKDAELLTLTATARGEPLDLERHEISEEVKAITWHALRVVQQGEGWLGEVILDL
jgi:SHS2 domain-containing protein